jgi:thiol-disulfide isomerase/thioredoxin
MNASLFVLSLASLAAAPQDVLYDFYSTSCGPCQMMMPIVHQLQAEGFPVRKIDVGQRPDLASRYGVSSVPTFILVIGGREQTRLVGMQEESTLRGLLAQIPQRKAAPAPAATLVESSPAPRPRRSTPVRLVDDDSSGSKWNFHLPIPSFTSRNQNQSVVQIDPPSSASSSKASAAADDTASMKNAIADVGSPNGAAPADETPRDDRNGGDRTGGDRVSDDRAAGDRPAADRAAGDRETDPRASLEAEIGKMRATSVRIRVKDANGVYFGSGVVIDSTPRRSIVLTCGHILRDVKEGSRIEVDLFHDKRYRTYQGAIIRYDLDADLGLVAVATRSVVPVSPIAPLDGAVHSGDPVVSIGCSQGEPPSIEQLRVTMLNRYVGPDTIECTGVPGQGRSGGGLFTAHGNVVGVCTNADPKYRRGVYAGLKPIHEILKLARLEDLIPGTAKTPRENLADATATVKADPAADEARRVKTDRDMEAPAPPPVRRATRTEESVAAQAAEQTELSPKVLEQSEVICIIRPINQPKGQSHVVIINRASRRFMAYLNGEMKDQLLPAMAHAPNDSQTVTANETPRAPQSQSADPADARTSWKPSATR